MKILHIEQRQDGKLNFAKSSLGGEGALVHYCRLVTNQLNCRVVEYGTD